MKQRIFTDLFFDENYVVDEYDKRDKENVLNLEERVYGLEVYDRRSTEYVLRTVCDQGPFEGGELGSSSTIRFDKTPFFWILP